MNLNSFRGTLILMRQDDCFFLLRLVKFKLA